MSVDPCRGLAPEPCGELASQYLTRSPADERAALPLLEAACARGSGESCTSLGFVRSDSGDRIIRDDRRALEAFIKGCGLGDSVACLGGGNISEEGSGTGSVARDFAVAAALYRSGCERGHALCCVALGNLYSAGGPGLEKNSKVAREYYRKAHKLGYRESEDGD